MMVEINIGPYKTKYHPSIIIKFDQFTSHLNLRVGLSRRLNWCSVAFNAIPVNMFLQMAVYTCIVSSVNSNRRILISVFALTDALRNLLFAIFRALNDLSISKANEFKVIKFSKSRQCIMLFYDIICCIFQTLPITDWGKRRSVHPSDQIIFARGWN